MANGGLLAAIGQGLKLGAGVMNPEIYAQQEQERAQSRLDAKQRQADLAKFILAAAQGGSLPSDQAKKALMAIDPRLAEQIPDIVLQPGMEAQRAQAKFTQEQEDRANRAAYLQSMGLPPGTPDSVAAALLKQQGADKPYSTLGKLAEDLRAGRITQAEYNDARRKATYIAPQTQPQPGDGFGNGMLGQAYEVVSQVEGLRQAGQPIPQDLAIKFRIAQHILQQPQLRAGPGGEMMTYTPGLPSFDQAGAPPAPRGTLETIRTAEDDGSADQAISALNDVAVILNDASQSGETVTGVVGTAKRLGGGLARQAGVPVKPNAERLARALERLKAIVGPSILQDSRLSDHERKRVEQIVGNVDPFTDEVALRESLSDLASILGRLQGGKKGQGQPQEQRRVVVDW